jgi:hypothetical protein
MIHQSPVFATRSSWLTLFLAFPNFSSTVCTQAPLKSHSASLQAQEKTWRLELPKSQSLEGGLVRVADFFLSFAVTLVTCHLSKPIPPSSKQVCIFCLTNQRSGILMSTGQASLGTTSEYSRHIRICSLGTNCAPTLCTINHTRIVAFINTD